MEYSFCSQYWLFSKCSLDEARNDLDAVFAKIQQLSKKKKLIYVGHNTGATAFLAYGASGPEEVKQKVAAAALLAPLAEMKNSGTWFKRSVGRSGDFFWKLSQILGLDKILSYHKYHKVFLGFVSSKPIFMFAFVRGKRFIFGDDKSLTAVRFIAF